MEVRAHPNRALPVLPGGRSFSLVELLIVCVIVGIMATVAIPRFANTLTRQRIEAAGRRVEADLLLAQRYARITGTSLTVTFEPSQNRYRLVGVRDPDHPTQEYVVRLDQPPYEVQIKSVNLGNDESVIFNGYGVADKGGTIELETGKLQLDLTVDDDTGRVTTEDEKIAAQKAEAK